ncbi:ABC transporter ATP-binding protein [Spirillospora sp. NPDC047279]|uniref:ABC transporter ATP-binding protein n=1 Tax=Spirillospora sp. NPDC047279 TaxID=3155478 RepID=UPI003402545D
MSALRLPAERERDLLRNCAAAVALAMRAAPGVSVAQIAATLAAGFVPVATAWTTKLVLDGIVARAPREELIVLVAVLACVGCAGLVLSHLTQYLTNELGRAVTLDSQDRLYAAVNRQTGLSRLEDPGFQDHLRLAQQAGGSGPGQVLEGMVGIVQGAVTLTGFVSVLVVLHPPMAVLLPLAAAPAMVPELALSRRRARMVWGVGPNERRELFYSDLLSSLTAAKEVRLFGLGDLFRTRMLTEVRAAHRERRLMDRREARTHTTLSVFSALISGAGLTWAVFMAASGRLSVGDVSVFVAAVAGAQGVLSGIIGRVADTHQALLLFGHFRHVIALEPDLRTAPAARTAPDPAPAVTGAVRVPVRRGIEFQDVWFRYGDDLPWTLRGLDLTLPPGRALGLVGVNGAGKSTIVKLLCRFYDPTRGRILWDGVDIADLPVADLRRRIGAVFQDYMSYDLSAAENIGIGDVRALDDRARIEMAAGEAGVHEALASLPRGYETMLSRMFFLDGDGTADEETGVLLSGGQWQRVALARAFLRTGRDLLILDEPSSGLDPEAEYAMHARLREFRRGTTSLLISHRLGSVRDADLIAVVEEGRVAETGTHAQLLERGGLYARLFRLQAGGYGVEVPT